MKTKLYLILSLLILIGACTKDPVDRITSTSGLTYQQSFNKWVAFKQSVNNSYSYTVTSSSWTGFSSQTKITVQNGAVTARQYTAVKPDRTIYATWQETAATLNTHTNGAQSLTLDDIYTQAGTVWLKADASSNTIYFETDNNGMISSCGYVPKNCADDCFIGVTITDIVGV